MDKDEIKTDIENKEDKDKSFYKKRIFDIIQIGKRGDLPSRSFDIFIVIVIILNIMTLILETFTREHYYPNARMEQAGEIDGFKIWRYFAE